MIQASFTITPSTGDVLATNFTITNFTTADTTIQQYTWDLGYDGLVYNVKDPVFTYPYPGTYTVTLTAIDKDGNSSTVSQQVSADLVYRDYITFTQIPERYADPGKPTSTPFKISVISATTGVGALSAKPLVVDLFATNSKSTPYGSVPDKWSFLTPTWKFTDINSNVVTSLSVVPVPVYKNNKVVAVSGTAEFYYIDSMSTGNPTENCPILLVATLQTNDFTYPLESNVYPYKSYANNETVKVGLLWQVNDLFPNLLKVTGNYVEDINPKQWRDIKTTTLITCHSNRALRLPGAEDSISEVIFSYPSSNDIGNLQPVQLSLTNLNTNEYSIDEAPLNFQATDINGSREGGYILTTVTTLTSISSTSIVAQTTAYTDVNYPSNQFIYPQGYAPNIPVWVSNPEKNTLNKITLVPYPDNCKTINYFKGKKILIDGTIKTVDVPCLSSSFTTNYAMSGFSGIYGMAIDPRNYDLIACDSELDRIYRYSNTGDLLKTFDLSSIGDYDPQKKMYDYWTWTTSTPPTTSTLFLFYGPTARSNNPANYILTLGGVIQPISHYYISQLQGFSLYTQMLDGILPPGNLKLDVIQLFSPLLPSKYIDSISYWITSSTIPTTTFTLTGSPSLSADSGYYIVSVNGVLQSPDSYTVSDTDKTIAFPTAVPSNAVVNIVYLPEINPPATWTQTFTYPTTSFSLTGALNYKPDNKSSFIVNVGGVLQAPVNYNIDIINQRLTFNTPLPSNTPVSVTQLSVPDVINSPAAYTPSYVSLDKDYNIWVSLFNSVSVLKLDKDFNLMFSVAPTGIGWNYRHLAKAPDNIDYQSSLFGYPWRNLEPNALTLDYHTDEFFLKPPVVETDRDNNCWVTYAHPLCCLLVKYSSTGQPLTQIPLSQYSTPVNIAVNSENNVWVSNTHNSTYTYTTLSGSLELYDSNTSALLDRVTGISRPGHIALDRNNNVWFTHSTRRIGYYNTSTSALSTWTLNLTGGFSLFTIPSATQLSGLKMFDEVKNQQDDEIGGLAVDVFNRVWILDNLQNYAWVISATPNFDLAPIRYFKIRPDVNLGYYVDINSSETYTESGDFYYRSAQATGDWTGNKWYQKYVNSQLLSSVSISGISVPFTVSEFVNVNQIRRVNDSFNSAEYLKSLALPENLNSNTTLFDKFFAASVGTGYLSANQDLGQTVYERIANFVSNHSDIDTCNIDQLLSLAEQTSTPASDYSAVYPTDILNMLDVASVPRAKLWGMKDEIPLLPQSVGEKYDVFTATVTAGDKIILKNKFDSTLSLINVPLSGGSVPIYPLSSFEGYGFVQPVTTNYLFYKFDPVYSGKYIENLIDWNSQYTTQSPTASTLEEWYGENGAIESAFRYLLTKNLFLK